MDVGGLVFARTFVPAFGLIILDESHTSDDDDRA